LNTESRTTSPSPPLLDVARLKRRATLPPWTDHYHPTHSHRPIPPRRASSPTRNSSSSASHRSPALPLEHPCSRPPILQLVLLHQHTGGLRVTKAHRVWMPSATNGRSGLRGNPLPNAPPFQIHQPRHRIHQPPRPGAQLTIVSWVSGLRHRPQA
jgi:hypothetical protein